MTTDVPKPPVDPRVWTPPPAPGLTGAHVAELVARAVGTGWSLPDAVTCGSHTPASLFGLADRGALRAGARADLVVLDETASVTRVMRAGRWLDS